MIFFLHFFVDNSYKSLKKNKFTKLIYRLNIIPWLTVWGIPSVLVINPVQRVSNSIMRL